MLKKIILIFFVLITSSYSQAVFSAYSIPVQDVFSDIKSDYKYINELQTLYDKGMIVPDSDGKFNPRELLNRDEFVGILGEVTCKKCIQPNVSLDLINKYEVSNIFFDVNKTNKYYYCIADSSNESYISGYHPGSACEDGTKLDLAKPFCPNNTIILEEALSIILRASGILSNIEADKVRLDIYNGKITQNLSDDVSPKNSDGSVYSFYPDFQKALDYELTEVDIDGNIKTFKLIDVVDGKIRPKQAISKEDFLRIAYVALKANSCIEKQENTLALNLLIKNSTCNSNDTKCSLSNLNNSNSIYDFGSDVSTKCEKGINEPEGYIWRFYNNNNGDEIKKYGKYIDDYNFLSNGDWKVFFRVVDNCGNTGEVYNSLYINNPKNNTNTNNINNTNTTNGMSISISSSKLTGSGPLSVDFSAIVSGGEGPYIYNWDFGDGNIGNTKDVKNIFKLEGVYAVTLYITDKNGLTSNSSVIIIVDGISLDTVDTDSDGVFDNNDLCPLIKGSDVNKGCPILEQKCSELNTCKYGTYCNSRGFCSPNLLANSCEYGGGDAIFGNAICNSCPCEYSLDFVSKIRKCDVIFPAITSPDSKSIYSRGEFYQLK
ncbi:MAG: PKD domain-containing protein [Candidatus Gracilibacteria bacterium]|nr:PKD domain-containing protein [Candidatus Gracilibacteria bacterium]